MINLFVTIDTECDKGKGWKIQKPISFNNISNGVANYLQPLFKKYNITPTYFLSPEIIRDEYCRIFFNSIKEQAELATHLHSEFIEPLENFDCDRTSQYQAQFSKDVETKKLRNLTILFQETFGFAPTSFRAGRFGISQHSLKILQDLGYKVDSSVTPDMWWKNGKSLVNYLGAPYQPYFPSAKNYKELGSLDILEVPVTTYSTRLFWLSQNIKKLIPVKKKWQEFVTRAYTRPGKKLKWIRPSHGDGKEQLSSVKTLLKYKKESYHQTYNNTSLGDLSLCMMFHSNEFTLGKSPYSLTSSDLDKLKYNIETFIDGLYQKYDVSAPGISSLYNAAKNKV